QATCCRHGRHTWRICPRLVVANDAIRWGMIRFANSTAQIDSGHAPMIARWLLLSNSPWLVIGAPRPRSSVARRGITAGSFGVLTNAWSTTHEHLLRASPRSHSFRLSVLRSNLHQPADSLLSKLARVGPGQS